MHVVVDKGQIRCIGQCFSFILPCSSLLTYRLGLSSSGVVADKSTLQLALPTRQSHVALPPSPIGGAYTNELDTRRSIMHVTGVSAQIRCNNPGGNIRVCQVCIDLFKGVAHLDPSLPFHETMCTDGSTIPLCAHRPWSATRCIVRCVFRLGNLDITGGDVRFLQVTDIKGSFPEFIREGLEKFRIYPIVPVYQR